MEVTRSKKWQETRLSTRSLRIDWQSLILTVTVLIGGFEAPAACATEPAGPADRVVGRLSVPGDLDVLQDWELYLNQGGGAHTLVSASMTQGGVNTFTAAWGDYARALTLEPPV